MSHNTAALTLTARNKVAQLGEAISRQRAVIKREEAVNKEKGETYKCNRARTTLASKKIKYESLEAEYQQKKAQLEAEIEAQEEIIWNETHRKSATVIGAEQMIEQYTKELNDIYTANGLMKTPKLQEVLETSEETSEEAPEPSEAFKVFMMDGRQDGLPMSTSRPSYLQGTAWGLCLTKEDKAKRYKNSES